MMKTALETGNLGCYGSDRPYVAFGDVHGDFDLLVELMTTVSKCAAVEDKGSSGASVRLRWTGGNTVVIFCGDLLDPSRSSPTAYEEGETTEEEEYEYDQQFRKEGKEEEQRATTGGQQTKLRKKGKGRTRTRTREDGSAFASALEDGTYAGELLVLRAIRHLDEQAQRDGGRVLIVLGNHDLWSITQSLEDSNRFGPKCRLYARTRQCMPGGDIFELLKNEDTGSGTATRRYHFLICASVGDNLFLHGGTTKTSLLATEAYARVLGSRVFDHAREYSRDVSALEILADALPKGSFNQAAAASMVSSNVLPETQALSSILFLGAGQKASVPGIARFVWLANYRLNLCASQVSTVEWLTCGKHERASADVEERSEQLAEPVLRRMRQHGYEDYYSTVRERVLRLRAFMGVTERSCVVGDEVGFDDVRRLLQRGMRTRLQDLADGLEGSAHRRNALRAVNRMLTAHFTFERQASRSLSRNRNRKEKRKKKRKNNRKERQKKRRSSSSSSKKSRAKQRVSLVDALAEIMRRFASKQSKSRKEVNALAYRATYALQEHTSASASPQTYDAADEELYRYFACPFLYALDYCLFTSTKHSLVWSRSAVLDEGYVYEDFDQVLMQAGLLNFEAGRSVSAGCPPLQFVGHTHSTSQRQRKLRRRYAGARELERVDDEGGAWQYTFRFSKPREEEASEAGAKARGADPTMCAGVVFSPETRTFLLDARMSRAFGEELDDDDCLCELGARFPAGVAGNGAGGGGGGGGGEFGGGCSLPRLVMSNYSPIARSIFVNNRAQVAAEYPKAAAEREFQQMAFEAYIKR